MPHAVTHRFTNELGNDILLIAERGVPPTPLIVTMVGPKTHFESAMTIKEAEVLMGVLRAALRCKSLDEMVDEVQRLAIDPPAAPCLDCESNESHCPDCPNIPNL